MSSNVPSTGSHSEGRGPNSTSGFSSPLPGSEPSYSSSSMAFFTRLRAVGASSRLRFPFSVLGFALGGGEGGGLAEPAVFFCVEERVLWWG